MYLEIDSSASIGMMQISAITFIAPPKDFNFIINDGLLIIERLFHICAYFEKLGKMMAVETTILPSFIFNPPCAPRPEEMVDLYKKLGLNEIEWLSELASPEYIAAFRDANVQIVSLVTGWIPFQNPMLGSSNPEKREEALQWFYQLIDQARDIGARYLSGAFGFLEEKSSKTMDDFLKALKSLREYAAGDPVLLIEKMRYPKYPGFTWHECVQIAAALKQPCSILRDAGHMANNGGKEKDLSFWMQCLPGEKMQYWHIYDAYHKPITCLDLRAFQDLREDSFLDRLILTIELFYTENSSVEQMYQGMRASLDYLRRFFISPGS